MYVEWWMLISFTLFVNKRLNLGHGKMFKGHGKGPGKYWNLTILKGYKPSYRKIGKTFCVCHVG